MIQNLATQDQIKELNSNIANLETIKTYQTSNGYMIKKVGKICILCIFDSLINITNTGWTEIGTIPTECKPLQEYRQISISYDSTFTSLVNVSWSVTTDSKLRVFSPSIGQRFNTVEIVWVTD